MINHVSIGVRDIAATKRFYDAALKPLGYKPLSESETSLGYGKDAVALWIAIAEHPVPADQKSGLHFCFDAPSRKSVAAFHAARSAPAGRITASPACARIMAAIITRPSWSIRTATGWKPIAAPWSESWPRSARR
jgi:catechol 2,3-dioxygenase-like lactoylglutathione lyase family enzyme